MGHFWPDFRGWLGQVTDTRVQERIVHRREFLTWMGLLVFLLKLGARRQVRFELDSPQALGTVLTAAVGKIVKALTEADAEEAVSLSKVMSGDDVAAKIASLIVSAIPQNRPLIIT